MALTIGSSARDSDVHGRALVLASFLRGYTWLHRVHSLLVVGTMAVLRAWHPAQRSPIIRWFDPEPSCRYTDGGCSASFLPVISVVAVILGLLCGLAAAVAIGKAGSGKERGGIVVMAMTIPCLLVVLLGSVLHLAANWIGAYIVTWLVPGDPMHPQVLDWVNIPFGSEDPSDDRLWTNQRVVINHLPIYVAATIAFFALIYTFAIWTRGRRQARSSRLVLRLDLGRTAFDNWAPAGSTSPVGATIVCAPFVVMITPNPWSSNRNGYWRVLINVVLHGIRHRHNVVYRSRSGQVSDCDCSPIVPRHRWICRAGSHPFVPTCYRVPVVKAIQAELERTDGVVTLVGHSQGACSRSGQFTRLAKTIGPICVRREDVWLSDWLVIHEMFSGIVSAIAASDGTGTVPFLA